MRWNDRSSIKLKVCGNVVIVEKWRVHTFIISRTNVSFVNE